MLDIQIIDAKGDVTVAVAERIGLRTPLVDRKLDLEVGFAIPQVDERETVEVEAVGDLQPEGIAVDRRRQSAPSSRTRIME